MLDIRPLFFIRAVILRGAGDKASAAGADIKAFQELNPDTAKRRLSRSHQIYAIVEHFAWPVIAAIHGYCLGGGLVRCAVATHLLKKVRRSPY
ncbi:MAG: enoyl-CoA hydratase/isomerase family protein [Deltaproteobacteria bacterium]|nr:MAG: enoyl-CoA hydratase/isomerase family protein [Deltaproteobacteria bacterium]